MSEQATHGVPVFNEGDRLGKALDFAGMSKQEMADYLGVSRNTIGNYTNGHVTIDKRTRMLWAMRTGVPIEWLESGVEPVSPPPHPEGEPARMLPGDGMSTTGGGPVSDTHRYWQRAA